MRNNSENCKKWREKVKHTEEYKAKERARGEGYKQTEEYKAKNEIYKARKRERYRQDPEKAKSRSRKYHNENRDAINAKDRARRAARYVRKPRKGTAEEKRLRDVACSIRYRDANKVRCRLQELLTKFYKKYSSELSSEEILIYLLGRCIKSKKATPQYLKYIKGLKDDIHRPEQRAAIESFLARAERQNIEGCLDKPEAIFRRKGKRPGSEGSLHSSWDISERSTIGE